MALTLVNGDTPYSAGFYSILIISSTSSKAQHSFLVLIGGRGDAGGKAFVDSGRNSIAQVPDECGEDLSCGPDTG